MSNPVTISLGEILWDVLPDGKTLGGAPANVAWHLSRLGAEAHIVSAIGNDDLGREILATLAEKDLDTATIAVLDGVPTSTVTASLDAGGNASYTIHENVAWDHLPLSDAVLKLAATARAVNYGSLGQRHPIGRATTHAILDAVDPDAVKVFDVNLRPPFIDRDTLDLGLSRATVVKMNHDELPQISAMFGWTPAPEPAMLQLLEAYPNLRHVLVTKGGDGAWWQTRETLHHRLPPKPSRLADTIGAGDSVTAAAIMGLLKGWDAEKILDSAMAIASYVCTQRGGMPVLPEALTRVFLH